MTLLRMTGFDENIFEQDIVQVGSSSLGNTGRSGNSKCVIVVNVPTTGLLLPFTTAQNTVVFGQALYLQGNNSGSNIFLRLREGTIAHIQIGNTATGQIQIYGPAGTVVASSAAGVWPAFTWRYIEVKVTIADSGGSVDVHVDGVSVVTYSGDTRNGGTGIPDGLEHCIGGPSGTLVDDHYILDSAGSSPYNNFLGDVAIRTLVPTADGDASDWLGSDGNRVANWQLVDEINPPSFSDYVSSFTSGETDLYNITDLTLPNSGLLSVLATQLYVAYKKSDAGAVNQIKPIAKGQSGTVREDSALPGASTSPGYRVGEVRTTDPDGNALTYARVNAMQIGVRVS